MNATRTATQTEVGTHVMPTVDLTTIPADICKGREPGYYPDLFNCAKYWHCDASGGQHFFCADGLVYEASKVQCDYPDRVDCNACGPLGSCNRPTCDCCDENCHHC